VTIIF